MKSMAPRSLSHHINLHHFIIALLLPFTLHLYTKNTKNIIYHFILINLWSPTGLIPWFSKTEGNTYATLLHHPLLFGEIQCSAQEVARRISDAVLGEAHASKSTIPSTHRNPYLSHYIICHFPLVFLSPTSPLPFYLPSLSLYPPSLSLFASSCPLAFCFLVC